MLFSCDISTVRNSSHHISVHYHENDSIGSTGNASARSGSLRFVRSASHNANAECAAVRRVTVTEPMLVLAEPMLALGTAWNPTYSPLCTSATGKSKNFSLLFGIYSGIYCLLVFTLEQTVIRQ